MTLLRSSVYIYQVPGIYQVDVAVFVFVLQISYTSCLFLLLFCLFCFLLEPARAVGHDAAHYRRRLRWCQHHLGRSPVQHPRGPRHHPARHGRRRREGCGGSWSYDYCHARQSVHPSSFSLLPTGEDPPRPPPLPPQPGTSSSPRAVLMKCWCVTPIDVFSIVLCCWLGHRAPSNAHASLRTRRVCKCPVSGG